MFVNIPDRMSQFSRGVIGLVKNLRSLTYSDSLCQENAVHAPSTVRRKSSEFIRIRYKTYISDAFQQIFSFEIYVDNLFIKMLFDISMAENIGILFRNFRGI